MSTSDPDVDVPDEWDLVAMLPNLVLRPPQDGDDGTFGHPWGSGLTLGSWDVAIVPPEDQRVARLCSVSSAHSQLVNGFVSSGGHTLRASVLIARRSTALDYQAILDFRNAVAFSFVLRAWARGQRGSGSSLAWSTAFDLHPTVPTSSGAPGDKHASSD